MYVILTGLGVVIMPLFVVATMMRIGNHSNDGVKIGSKRRTRSQDLADDCIYANYDEGSKAQTGGSGERKWNLFGSLWRHGLPVGGLLHVISAICFLLPRVMMEAQLIGHGLLPRGKHFPSYSGCHFLGAKTQSCFPSSGGDNVFLAHW